MDERFKSRRRISDIYETDNVSIANFQLHNGWNLMKAIISNGKSFYILVRYEEEEKCGGTNLAAT